MNYKLHIKCVLFVICCIGINQISGQNLESETVKFNINNIMEGGDKDVVNKKESTPPTITLLAPVITEGAIFRTEVEYIDLIGQVLDESAIEYFSMNSEMKEVNEAGTFHVRVKLKPGLNNIHLMSLDEHRNIKKLNVSVDFDPPIVTLEDRIKYESTYYGLIIGINDYEDPNLPDLDNPINDAETLYNTIIAKYSFEPKNVWILKNPKRIDIIRELDKLRRMVSPSDNLLLFYAGHGHWDEQAEIGYWLPSDASSDITADWFRNSTLVDYIKAIDSKHTLLITDACFAGSIFKPRSVKLNQENVYEKIYDMPSRKAMTSGAMTEVPDESAFLKYLIKNLNENSETYLSSEQLFSRFKIAVISNSNAVPQYGEIRNVGNEGGDFIFLKKNQ